MLTTSSNGPLSGLVVIDMTRVLAGPYCTLMLADLGARVIKVEIPGVGDDARHVGPFVDNGDGTSTSAYFLSVNGNKESIALDLKADADRAILDKLIANADVLVENFTPGTLGRLGYGWQTLHARHPSLILASISGFGQTGPYRELPAYDMVVQAMGGILSLTGEDGGPPTRVGVSIGDIAAGMFGAVGVLAALVERQKTHQGKHVDVAMLDSQVALLENALARYQVDHVAPGPIGSRHPSITPFGVYKAADGYLVVAAGNDRKFAKLCEALGMSTAAVDARFLTNADRCKNHRELKAMLETALATRPAKAWMQILQEQGIPTGPMNDVAAVMKDPHIHARDMLIPVPLPNGKSFVVAGCPVKFADSPSIPRGPSPKLDEHRRTLLRELGVW